MRQAAGHGARLMVTTEGALSSYPGKRVVSSESDRVAEADWSRVSWSTIDDELVRVRRLAPELHMWVVVGCVWREDVACRPFNSLVVIDDRGDVSARYDKRYLSNTESGFMYRAGRDAVTVTIDGLSIGFLLCIEAMLPDAVIEYESLGVDAIVIASYTDQTSSESQDDQRALAHATMIDGWVIFAVPGIATGDMTSGIAAPDYRWLERGVPTGERQVVIADLDQDDARVKFGRERGRVWRARQRHPLG